MSHNPKHKAALTSSSHQRFRILPWSRLVLYKLHMLLFLEPEAQCMLQSQENNIRNFTQNFLPDLTDTSRLFLMANIQLTNYRQSSTFIQPTLLYTINSHPQIHLSYAKFVLLYTAVSTYFSASKSATVQDSALSLQKKFLKHASCSVWCNSRY